MQTVTSTDGTRIAYSRTGSGPALVLVDGAFGYRAFGPNPALAEQLAPHFTVYTYDRRGRGDSGDAPAYAVEREVEDIAAVIAAAGGSAHLYGISSGATLALDAANAGLPVSKLAIYEAPFVVDDTRAPVPEDYASRMDAMLASGRYGAAVSHFMRKGVGVPGIFVLMMRLMPAWKQMKAIAPTLAYDTALTVAYQQGKPLPVDAWGSVTMPTLVIAGGKSPDWMRNGMRMLADVLPNASHYTLEGQTHIVDAKALAPPLIAFFED